MDRMTYGKARINEIEAGKKSGIDVSIYDDIKYDGRQMYQLRKGLEAGIDVSLYANEEFTNRQMEQIRLGLEAGLHEEDVAAYAKVGLTVERMIQVRECMEHEYLNNSDLDMYSPSAMDCIREAIRKHYDVSQLIYPEFNNVSVMSVFSAMKKVIEGEEEIYAEREKKSKKKGFFSRFFK